MNHPTSSTLASCPECGAGLAVEAPQGLCPACLMRQALHPTEDPQGSSFEGAPSLAEVAAAFPHLEVMGLIGRGGMGAVFRARQPHLGRLVALKVIPASREGTAKAFAERFEREGRLLARLHHPNIVTIYDSGRAGKFFYLLMEHVDGVNLRQAMRASRFAPAQALGLVPQICEALQYAHDQGVLHRDIKPENILLDARGRVKLADFGIAKLASEADGISTVAGSTSRTSEPAGLTQVGVSLGTPKYMAPEQAADPQSVDHRADIYSLGVVFYELLTGELPPAGEVRPSDRVEIDHRVDAIVQQALERERDRRQRTAEEMRTQITAVNSGPSSEAPKVSPPGQRWWRARWLRNAALVVGIVMVIRTFFLEVYVAKTDAGAPELPAGSWVVVWKLPFSLSAGDFVLYREDGRAWIGRLLEPRDTDLLVRRFGNATHVVQRQAVIGKVIAQTRRGMPSQRIPSRGVETVKVSAAAVAQAQAALKAAEQRHRAGLVDEFFVAEARHSVALAEAGEDRLRAAVARMSWAREKEAFQSKRAAAGLVLENVVEQARLERVAAEAALQQLLTDEPDLSLAAPRMMAVPLAEWIRGTWAFDAEHSAAQARVTEGATTEESRAVAEEALKQLRASLAKNSEGMRWTITATEMQSHHAPEGLRSGPYVVLEERGPDAVVVRTTDDGQNKLLLLSREGERLKISPEPPPPPHPLHMDVPAYYKRTTSLPETDHQK